MNSQIYSINKIVLMVTISIFIVGGYVIFGENVTTGQGAGVVLPPGPEEISEMIPFNKTSVWFSNATEKISKEANPQTALTMSEIPAKIKAAKNEYENFQIVVSSLKEEDEHFSVEITDFIKLDKPTGMIETSNIDMYEVNYVNVKQWIIWDGNGNEVVGENAPDYWMPDPLVPMSLESNGFTLKSFENQPVWFNVYIPKNTPSGLYYATVLIKFESGKTVHKKIELEVYDFTLPDEFGLKSLFGLYVIDYHFFDNNTISDEEYNKIVEKYYEEFKRKRINPFMYNPAFMPMQNSVIKHTISNGVLTIDEETYSDFQFFADKYLKNPDEKTFNTFIYRGSQHMLGDMSGNGSGDGSGMGLGVGDTAENKLQWITLFNELQTYMQNNDLESKAVYYSVDELSKQSLLNEFYIERTTRLNDWINMGSPDLERIASVWLGGWNERVCGYKDVNGKNEIITSLEEYIFPYNDNYLLSDGSKQFDTWILNIRGLIPDTIPLIEERQALGEKFWFYDNDVLTSITHKYPQASWYPIKDKEGVANRILPWILWKLDGEGLSNYAVNYYGCKVVDDELQCNNPWKMPVNVAPDGTKIQNGTGFLFYPPCGKTLGENTIKCENETSNEIILSIRWMLLGEGMEDYEYFKILKSQMIDNPNYLIGEDAMNNAMSLVSTCYYDFEGNPVKYYDAKDRIANAIEILQ